MIVTLIGILAAILTTITFLPQAIKTIKTKSTKDLSLLMLVVQFFGNLFWSIYDRLIVNIPLIFANSITLTFVFTILFYKIKEI